MFIKLFIFDLDLTLWNGRNLYPDVYNILTFLKSINKIMYVVSYHTHAKMCCEYLQIDKFFHNILYDRRVNKDVMIKKILDEHKNVNEKEMVFYDDQITNVINVQQNNKILSILINDGLSWEHILKLKSKKFLHDNSEKIKSEQSKLEKKSTMWQKKVQTIYKNYYQDVDQMLIYKDLKITSM